MPQTRPIERKLTTILSADAANYSGRMRRDEDGTVRALRIARDIIDREIETHGGRIANTSGDGLIAEFPSVVSAAQCAVSAQQTLNARDDLLSFRMGLHLGDVIVEGQDLLGDGVNRAARLQERAEVGGILVSKHVIDHVHDRLKGVDVMPLGQPELKHVGDDMDVFALVAEGLSAPRSLQDLAPQVAPARRDTHQRMPDRPSRIHPFVVANKGLFWGLGAVVAIDVLTGAPFYVMIIPEAIILYQLYKRWRAYRSTS